MVSGQSEINHQRRLSSQKVNSVPFSGKANSHQPPSHQRYAALGEIPQKSGIVQKASFNKALEKLEAETKPSFAIKNTGETSTLLKSSSRQQNLYGRKPGETFYENVYFKPYSYMYFYRIHG